MELRQPETLGVLDHHHARFRHIDADLDHGGGDQEPGPPGGEPLHGTILLRAAHPAVDQTDGRAEALLQILEAVLGGGEIDGFGFLDQRTDPINPPALVERARHATDDFVEAA